MAIYAENDTYDHLLFNYAHWTMCLGTLEVLSYNAISMSTEQKTYYTDYVNGDRSKQKTKFIFFVRAYQDFFGFLINIHNKDPHLKIQELTITTSIESHWRIASVQAII
jgi:hypothetical protein